MNNDLQIGNVYKIDYLVLFEKKTNLDVGDIIRITDFNEDSVNFLNKTKDKNITLLRDAFNVLGKTQQNVETELPNENRGGEKLSKRKHRKSKRGGSKKSKRRRRSQKKR